MLPRAANENRTAPIVKAKQSRKLRKAQARNAPPGGTAALKGWYAGKAPLLLFGLKFCVLTALFYLILQIPFCQKMVSAVTIAEARLSGVVLNILGQHNHVDGSTLSTGSHSVIQVVSSCSGFDFLSFFSAAVLVFPVPFAKKAAGMLIGLPLLMALNLVRIVSLYLVGVHFPKFFDFVHEEIWALILISVTIILYIVWMRWAGAANHPTPDAAA